VGAQRLRTAFPYLSVLICGIVLAQFLDYLTSFEAFLFGQTMGLVFFAVSVAVAVPLWLRVADSPRMPPLSLAIVALLVALWAVVITHARIDGSAFNYSALLTPIILIMVAWKPPPRRDAWRLADFSFTLIASIAIVTQILDLLGIRDARTSIFSRWTIPLIDFDLGFRWEGFFGDPNNAGLIGAVLVVYGLHRKGWMRVFLVVVGAGMVLFAESRTALLGLAAGLVLTIVTSRTYRRRKIHPLVTGFILILISIAGLLAVRVIDPSLNGRREIWQAYLELFITAPVTGVGWSGIDAAAANSLIPWQTIDGHSIIIDTLTRHGFVATLLVLATLIMALILVIIAIPRDNGTSLAVFSVWLFAALTYTLTTWQYLNVLMIPFIITILLASARQPSREMAAV